MFFLPSGFPVARFRDLQGRDSLRDQLPPSPATVINSAIPNISWSSSVAKGATFFGSFRNGFQLGHCDRRNRSPNIGPTSTSVTNSPPTGPSLTGTAFLAALLPRFFSLQSPTGVALRKNENHSGALSLKLFFAVGEMSTIDLFSLKLWTVAFPP